MNVEEQMKEAWERIVKLEEHTAKLTAKLAEHGIHVAEHEPAGEPEPQQQ